MKPTSPDIVESPPRRHRTGSFALLMTVVVLVGVIGSQLIGSSADSTRTTVEGSAAPPGAPRSGAAPDFTVTAFFDGATFRLSDHIATEGRPVILNLWASWCYPCRVEMPDLDAAALAHPEVQFVGIAVEDTPASALGFAEEVRVSYPLAHDVDGLVDIHYPAPGLPATYVIDGSGEFVRVAYGAISRPQIEAMISEVVGH